MPIRGMIAFGKGDESMRSIETAAEQPGVATHGTGFPGLPWTSTGSEESSDGTARKGAADGNDLACR